MNYSDKLKTIQKKEKTRTKRTLTKVNISERATADLPPQAILVPNSQLHVSRVSTLTARHAHRHAHRHAQLSSVTDDQSNKEDSGAKRQTCDYVEKG